MTTTAQGPRTIPGVTALSHRCWVLIDPATGKPYEAEEITHYDDFEDATCAIAAAFDVRPEAEPRQLDVPCFTATPACGEKFEADGMILHFPSIQAIHRDLDACGWRVVDGRLCCEDCGEACGL